MKDVTAISKRNGQAIIIRRRWIGLIFNGGFIQRISTNRTRIGTNIPGPHGHGIPFFDFKPRNTHIALGLGGTGGRSCRRRGVSVGKSRP